jgi:hypothetical protein
VGTWIEKKEKEKEEKEEKNEKQEKKENDRKQQILCCVFCHMVHPNEEGAQRREW